MAHPNGLGSIRDDAAGDDDGDGMQESWIRDEGIQDHPLT
jgi:hypothetical protein